MQLAFATQSPLPYFAATVTLILIAHDGRLGAGHLVGKYSLPLVRGTVNGRSVLDARTIHIADVQSEAREYPEGSNRARTLGHRTELSVPLLRNGVAVGSISLRRSRVQPFTGDQIALMETFADQALIAIENARLFEAEQASNRELQESLEYQTAISNVLGVISRSPVPWRQEA